MIQSGAVSPSPVASSAFLAAFSPCATAAAFSPAAYFPGVPLANAVDMTPSSGHMGYSSPYVGQNDLGNLKMGTPKEQAKRLREMQQKWQAAARFFHEREQCTTPAHSPESASTAPTPGSRSTPSQSPAVISVSTKAYTPGEMLSKTAECSVSAEVDMRSDCSTTDSTEAASASPEPAYVPEHSNVSSDPKFNLTEVPSIGSVGHYTGDCKPCAFFLTKGCENAKNCKFCHLCDSGEKKRRLKAKKAHFNALKEAEASLVGDLSFLM